MATRNSRRGLSTNQTNSQQNAGDLRGTKRNQEASPNGKPAKRTRTVFGDLTNKENVSLNAKKAGAKKKAPMKGAKKKTTVVVPKAPPANHQGVTDSQAERDVSWEVIELSQESHSSNSQQSNNSDIDVDAQNEANWRMSQNEPSQEARLAWEDIDAENMADPFQVALYAQDIFDYYKRREAQFVIGDYLSWQHDLNAAMRAILVDWLVEVQENFELNHETLYLAVKLVDHFLCRAEERTRKSRLQLVGATAMFIAAKFDERFPPVLDDFLYVCDDAYSREQLTEMERCLLKAIDFDLGIPLSYRYLRRFAKCVRADVETLTLARYALEMSLMDYALCRTSDCRLAAAALLLARGMKREPAPWNETLEHYTGYTRQDVSDLVRKLHKIIARAPNPQLQTIRTKYSHKVFHEVAKIEPLEDVEEIL